MTKVGTWPDGSRLTIYRETDITQAVDLRNGDIHDAEVDELIADKLTAISQETAETASRQVSVPISDTAATLTIPPIAERANKFLSFDAAGNIQAAVGMASAPATTFGASLIDDADAAEARATLEITATGAEINLQCDKSANTKIVDEANYTILDNDGYLYILAETGSSDRTITLPTAADNSGRILHIVKSDVAGTGKVIVDGEGAETIDGSATLTISRSVMLRCNGTSWDIIGSVDNGYEAQTGKKIGLEIYYVGSQSLRVRAGKIHVDDGKRDYWVKKLTETTIDSSTPNWPTNGTWVGVFIDYLGVITLLPATGTNAQRPTDAFYQWQELGGGGYDHLRQGFYYNNKRCIGHIHKVSDTSYYFIYQGSGSDEFGYNLNGVWTRTGKIQEVHGSPVIETNTTVTFPVAFYGAPSVVGGIDHSSASSRIVVNFGATTNTQTIGYANDDAGTPSQRECSYIARGVFYE